MKRTTDQIGHDVSKKRKIPQGQCGEFAVGHGPNILKRHALQLQCLVALMSSKKSPLQLTDDKWQVLNKNEPQVGAGVYLEWLKKQDTYFLWGSDKGHVIKFEFHGGFENEAIILDVKRPLLAFSEGFDTHNWREVKQLLVKMFGHSHGNQQKGDPDYLIAFTRTKETVSVRVFKILELPPQRSNKSESMRLQYLSPTFLLKPLEVHHKVDGGDNVIEHFFDEKEFLLAENNVSFSLDRQSVCNITASSQLSTPHAVVNKNSLIMLPLPSDDWCLGFNTSCSEFFERYVTVRAHHVPGKPAESEKSDKLIRPLRIFMRSLILQVGEAFERNLCFNKFTHDNVFLRRSHAAIVGVRLVRYTDALARENLRAIMNILLLAPKRPKVLEAVVRHLVMALSSVVTPRDVYPILANNFVWMDALDKHHMIADLFQEFTVFLSEKDQIAVVKAFFLHEWEKEFLNHNMMDDVRAFLLNRIDKNLRVDEEAYKRWKEQKALADYANLSYEDAMLLLNGKMYFGTIRNCYTHLPEHGIKAHPLHRMKLSPEQVDFIVASTLGDVGSYLQENMPKCFAKDDPRGSPARFRIYFNSEGQFADYDTDDEVSEDAEADLKVVLPTA